MVKRQRFKIDNAGIMFSSIMTSKWIPTFQFTVELKETVDPVLLEQAIHQTLPRFPGFNVRLKKGLFWHYFEEADLHIKPQYDSNTLSSTQSFEPLFRMRYCDKKISLDIVHVLSDGYGALVFFKTILYQYFLCQGISCTPSQGILDVNEKPCSEEFEDAYERYRRKAARPLQRGVNAFHPKGPPLPNGQAALISGIMNADDVLEKARAHKATVTEYLAAVLIQTLRELQCNSGKKKSRPVKLCITANLRKYFPTNTLRIFSGYCNAGIKPGYEYTFQEILWQIQEQCSGMFTEKNQNACISKNVSYEKNFLIRIIPLFIKKHVLSFAYFHFGQRSFSMNLTNMGNVEMPNELKEKIERFSTMSVNLRHNKYECGVLSFNHILTVSFTRAIDDSFIEEHFFETLRQAGITVEIQKQGSETLSDEKSEPLKRRFLRSFKPHISGEKYKRRRLD